MKLSVFGQGKLGKPIADVLEKHFDVARVDPALGMNDDYSDADAHVIIVPTPSDADGRFVTDSVEAVLSTLAEIDNGSPAILMSTVMPGSCRRLQAKFPKHPIIYSPQFVDLGHVAEKFENPDFVLAGMQEGHHEPWGIVAEMFFTTVTNEDARVHVMPWESAEIAKLAVNNFLALKLDFVNLIQGWCMENEVDWKPVFSVLQSDPRIGERFMSPGFGHGGPCLTRDRRALGAIAHFDGESQPRIDFTSAILRQCGTKVAVLGRTYKPHVPVADDSHVLQLIQFLKREMRLWDSFDPLLDEGTLEDAIKGADTVVIGVPYKQFDIDYGDRKVINPWGGFWA